MTRRRVAPLLVALLMMLTAGCDPDPGGSTSTTWEWLFRGPAGAGEWGPPLVRRHCEVLWTYNSTGAPAGAPSLQTAASAAAADMERLTGVPVDYAGARQNLSDLTVAANFPVEVKWLDMGPAGYTMPTEKQSYEAKDFIGGFVYIGTHVATDAPSQLGNLVKHEWGHIFNVGDLYDGLVNKRYDASVGGFRQITATGTTDFTQRMGDSINPWGSGDKEGLWEAGAAARSTDCLHLIRTGTGMWAYRLYEGLYGVPSFDKLVLFEMAVRNDPVAAAQSAFAEPGGSTWTAKPRDEFLADAWMGLTNQALTPDELTYLRAAHDQSGRAATYASMANSEKARNHLPKTQGITMVFANIIQRMPTSAEITQYADMPYGQLRDFLYYDSIAGTYLYAP